MFTKFSQMRAAFCMLALISAMPLSSSFAVLYKLFDTIDAEQDGHAVIEQTLNTMLSISQPIGIPCCSKEGAYRWLLSAIFLNKGSRYFKPLKPYKKEIGKLIPKDYLYLSVRAVDECCNWVPTVTYDSIELITTLLHGIAWAEENKNHIQLLSPFEVDRVFASSEIIGLRTAYERLAVLTKDFCSAFPWRYDNGHDSIVVHKKDSRDTFIQAILGKDVEQGVADAFTLGILIHRITRRKRFLAPHYNRDGALHSITIRKNSFAKELSEAVSRESLVDTDFYRLCHVAFAPGSKPGGLDMVIDQPAEIVAANKLFNESGYPRRLHF